MKIAESPSYFLREIVSTDIENVYQGLSNPDITKYYDVHFSSLEATKEQMDWYASLVKEGKGQWWAITDKKTEEFVGAAGYNGIDTIHKKAEVGMWLLKEHWGKGILKEVMPVVFELGFRDFDLNRIEGYVVSDNVKCKKALEKIQFKREGTMRQCEFKNGAWIDVDIYAVLRGEWNLE